MLVKEDHSTPLQHHLTSLRMTGWYLILWLMMIAIDRWSDLPISSASVHDVLVDQLQPQSDKSGALSFPVIPLVRVAEPSLRTCRSSLMILSVIFQRISGGFYRCSIVWLWVYPSIELVAVEMEWCQWKREVEGCWLSWIVAQFFHLCRSFS